MLNVAISVAVKVEGTALAAGVVDSVCRTSNFTSVMFIFFVREFTSCTPVLLYVYLGLPGPLTCKPGVNADNPDSRVRSLPVHRAPRGQWQQCEGMQSLRQNLRTAARSVQGGRDDQDRAGSRPALGLSLQVCARPAVTIASPTEAKSGHIVISHKGEEVSAACVCACAQNEHALVHALALRRA